MLRNYLTTSWRHLWKNRLYTSINVLCLVIGLSVYMFGSILATYEQTHDLFYRNADRIFTVGSSISPTSNMGVKELDGIHTAVAPLIKADVPEISAVARTVGKEYLLTIDTNSYYEFIRFTDPALTEIFDFDYVEGNEQALADPNGMLITRSIARKFFGDAPALGQTVTLDQHISLRVTAVIEDLPPNTHFNSAIHFERRGLDVMAPLAVLNQASGYKLAGNWTSTASGNLTYVLAPPDRDQAWLQTKLDGVYESHFPLNKRETFTGFRVHKLSEVNTIIWDMTGMPMITSIRLLALLILIVAIVNYTNLATAQSLLRTREVGLRKTMGASRAQLLQQFLVESLTVAFMSMLIALALLEVTLPLFNAAADRAVKLEYSVVLPWLLITTVAVGLIAGAYPAFTIIQTKPIEALRDKTTGVTSRSRIRSALLGLQFTIGITMSAIVLVIYFQNEKIQSSSDIYPRSEVLTLKRLGVDAIQARAATLKNEIEEVEGVQSFAYSSQVPFEQRNRGITVTAVEGDKAASFDISSVSIDGRFLTLFEIPILAGRDLDASITSDTMSPASLTLNVVVNELTLGRLGFGSPAEAIGRTFYDYRTDSSARALTIVGVVPDQNFQGFHNQTKPTMFLIQPSIYRIASVRIEHGDMVRSIKQIESIWSDLVPEYPIQIEFLNETFNEIFRLYATSNQMLAGFAFLAFTLSLIGLFGLAAFMATSRTKEIGLRKVMGASINQIVMLLIWQFSRPVLWAMLVALPLSYFASQQYVRFFADRISGTEIIVLGAGILAVAISWVVVSVHAVRIAKANPVLALRCE